MHGHLRRHDRGAEVLVGAFEPRRQVHRVAHHRVVEAPPRADIADQRLAGIEADAVGQLVTLEGRRGLVELFEPVAATQRRAHRVAGMVGIVDRRAEHRDDGIADVFVDIAAVAAR